MKKLLLFTVFLSGIAWAQDCDIEKPIISKIKLSVGKTIYPDQLEYYNGNKKTKVENDEFVIIGIEKSMFLSDYFYIAIVDSIEGIMPAEYFSLPTSTKTCLLNQTNDDMERRRFVAQNYYFDKNNNSSSPNSKKETTPGLEKKDTMPIAGISKSYAALYDDYKVERKYLKSLKENQPILIYDVKINEIKDTYLAVYTESDSGYINIKEAFVRSEDELKSMSKSNLEKRKYYAKYFAVEFYKSELEKEIKTYEDYQKIGLMVTQKKYAYAEYGGQFGLTLTFYNGYKKDIKYIDLTIRSYNRVGDPIQDDLGRNVVRPQVIGPLSADSEATVTFDELFWDDRDVINRLVITYMKVTFMDGSVKEITDVSKHLAKDVYNQK